MQSSGQKVYQNWQGKVKKMALWQASQSDEKKQQEKAILAQTNVRFKNTT